MSLVLCDITTSQILFLADSARPTENTDPKNYPNDAVKVLRSPNKLIGVGLVGTLNFPWQCIWTQPEKWVDMVLQKCAPNEVDSPGKIAAIMKQKIEGLRGVPYNDRGILIISGFADGAPEVYELEVKSKSIQDTALSATQSTPTELPRMWGLLSWQELLSIAGKTHDQLPQNGQERYEFLEELMKAGITDLRAKDDFRVAEPVVSIRILKPIISSY